jgi:CRP/FNR family cyclic AMP-dependent transcriptional regulator
MAFDIAAIGGGELKHVTVSDGRAVFLKDDPADAAYLVKSGRIEIRDGPRALETVGPGGLFGEMALADAAPRDDTAVAVGEVELIVIDRATFERLVREQPDFATSVMRVMAERLRRTAAAGHYDPLDARRITGASAQAG